MKMENKIEVESEKIVFDNDNSILEKIDGNKKIEVIVNSSVHAKLDIIAHNNYDINIVLNNDSSLIVNSLNKDNNVNVFINLLDGANITYNHSVLGIKDSINSFTLNHENSNTTSVLNNNGINIGDNKLYFNIDGVIPKNILNASCSQNSKIINFMEGDSKIIPNLIIDSNDIIANHSAYIGEIDEKEKFYLASRGISDKEINYLIYKSCLLGKMELFENEDEFKKTLNEWW